MSLRMVAAVAYMGGHDIRPDQVQTMCYACLTGSAAADVLKQAGIKIREKVEVGTIKKIPALCLS